MAQRHALRFAVIAALSWAVPASAQGAPHGGATAARGRPGGCSDAALDGYDRAVAASPRPELRRDRGACHDRLGHPFPAIDDYRAYLTARPEAPDAEALRARLQQLETQVGILHPSGEGGSRSGASVELSLSTSGAAEIGGDSGGQGRDLGALEAQEQLDAQADASPLRRGTGLVLGLVFDPLDYAKAGLGWAEIAGIDLRYSFSSVSAVLLEVNYDNVNASGSASSLGGAGLLGGYEARVPLNPRVSDALLLGATLSYEHLKQGASGVVFSALQPRGRLGYRHVFGPTLGLEGALDAGIAFLHVSGTNPGAPAPGDTSAALVGGHIALVLGF